MPKGSSGEFLDAFVFANFDAGDVPVNVKAGQHTVYWGDSLLLGGAIHSAFVRAESARLCRRASRRRLARRRNCFVRAAESPCRRSRRMISRSPGNGSITGRRMRIPESGSYLTIQDPLNFGGDSLIFGPNPLAAANPGAPT